MKSVIKTKLSTSKRAPYPLVTFVVLLSALAQGPVVAANQVAADPAANQAWGSDDGWADTSWGDADTAASPWLPMSGFVELGVGARLADDASDLPRETLGEGRARLETGYKGQAWQGKLRGDLRYDDVVEGWQLDLRELTASKTLGEHIDVKLGRQVLTWGTGDLLFLNDLYAKDWQAFFSGLDEEYLKAPVNALKVSYFGAKANLDLAWIPYFEGDNYINGERFSYFSPQSGSIVSTEFDADAPHDDALAARVFGQIGSAEYALYGYWGYTGQPLAADNSGNPAFARLNAYGASLLRPLGSGLVNVEVSYHDMQDQNGGDVSQPMDKTMALAGYQQELIANLTLGVQYQWEHKLDYDAWADNYPYSDYLEDEDRHLITLRLNYRALQEKLSLSLMSFYSPSDEDYYLRPQVSYRFNDHWLLASGLNLLDGQDEYTFFGQMADNSNAWTRVRYSY
jgi:hypothetical protein